MSDYIDREAAINAFYTATSDGDKAEWCVGVIESIPAADVRPVKKGGWEEHGEPNERGKYEVWYYQCTRCGAVGHPEFKFCPNCGASMVNENERQTD